MSRLKELSQDKVTIMTRLIENSDLCKAVYYTDEDFLSQPNIEDTSTLIYSHVFPYRKVPGTQEVGKTFITMSFHKYRPIDNFFKSGIITFYVLVNQANMKTSYGCLRTDYIISIIDELVNQTYGLGIGKLQFHSMDDLVSNSDYLGVEISYKKVDLN